MEREPWSQAITEIWHGASSRTSEPGRSVAHGIDKGTPIKADEDQWLDWLAVHDRSSIPG